MVSAVTIFNQHFTRSHGQCNKVRKETKEVKLSLFTDDLIICEENLKQSIKIKSYGQ